jgi:hypothetical protein
MALIDIIFILGISKPRLVAEISNAADASGVVVPMPTLCEKQQ